MVGAVFQRESFHLTLACSSSASQDESARAKVTFEGKTRDLGKAEAIADAQRQLRSTRKAVEMSKPEWVTELEKKKVIAASSGRTRSARGR